MLATLYPPLWEGVAFVAFWFVLWQAIWNIIAWKRKRFGLRALLILVTGHAILLAVFAQTIRILWSRFVS
jgi:hypothetical protein